MSQNLPSRDPKTVSNHLTTDILDIEGEAFHPDWNYAIKPRILKNP